MDVQARVDAVAWYHEFDFGNGVRARSRHENPSGVREVWSFIERHLERMPFHGASVLDVGAWDGYWSFFAERHGARQVLATDDATQRWARDAGIELAKELLRSSVEVREDVPVYELAALGRTFDIVLCLGVHYHLWDPLYALTQLRQCCHSDTIVIVEGELGWGGMQRNEVRFAQSAWQECVLSSSALEWLLRLAYFRVTEQVWMHPIPADPPPGTAPRLDRSLLVCRPFQGINAAYTYRPHFDLARFDDRFAAPGASFNESLRAEVVLLDAPSSVASGEVFVAVVEVTNSGAGAWRCLNPDARPARWLAESREPEVLDVAAAFLDKDVVNGACTNTVGVSRYRAHIEGNWQEGAMTVGARLFDQDGQRLIDQDYSRGFIEGPLEPGCSAVVRVRMRAPRTPGEYLVAFEPVCEYVAWLSALGTEPVWLRVAVR